MRSILEELACGNISPDIRFLKHNSEYGKAVKALTEAEEKLRSVLNEAERELLNVLIVAQGAVNNIANTDKFVHGYRLGALITTEVFIGKEDLLIGGDS